MAKKKNADKIRETELTENLKCMLTEEEIKQSGEAMARLIQDKARLEDDRKSAMASFTAKIAAADASIIDHSNKVRDKYEYRDIDCIKRQNFTTGTLKMIRSDTKAIYEDRKMNVREKQEENLFDSKAE